MAEESSWIWLLVERRSRWGFRYVQNLRIIITVKLEFWNNGMTSVLIKPHFFCRFFGAYDRRFHSKHRKGSLWWETRRNTRFGMEQRRGHQDTEAPVEHRSTAPSKCVQHEWSGTGKTADAVGTAFQTVGCWWPSTSAGTRSSYRNRHKLDFRSRHAVKSKRRVC